MHHGPPAGRPAWTRYFGIDYNHKVIGIQYGVTGLLLLMIGGTFALIFRTELAEPGMPFLTMQSLQRDLQPARLGGAGLHPARRRRPWPTTSCR